MFMIDPQNRVYQLLAGRSGNMNMQEIRGIARDMGIKAARLRKVDLVRTIQVREGNFSCFATASNGDCDQQGCIWRNDCFAMAQKQLN
jgi:hypothetical protein